MHRPRARYLSLTFLFAFFLIFGARGRGQSGPPVSGVVVGYFAPPAIEHGLMPDLSRSPDSAEARMRASVRADRFALERVGAGGARYVAGKVIVKFRDLASPAARVSARSAVGASAASEQPSYADFEIVRLDPADDAEAAARALAARPDVEYAQAAYRVHTAFVPNDKYYAKQWNLPDIGLERAWDIQPAAGSTITVAVVDTGIAYTNATMQYVASSFRMNGATYPALGALTLPFVAATELGPSSRFVAPHDFIWDNNLPLDSDGHGTHVSGTIGQLTNNANTNTGDAQNQGGTAGVAFNVKLMPVKVLDSDWDDIFGSPNQGTDDTVARGIRYAADNGAKVINLSLGRTGPAAPTVADAIRYAVGKGAFVVIAAGNEFEDGNGANVIGEIANGVSGAVSVAALDRAHCRAYYSTTGAYVELAAPGGSFRAFGAEGGILQQTLDLQLVETFTQPPSLFSAPRFDVLAYYYFIGTSQATPHVSGLAAMLMQQGITDPGAVEGALERFAIDPRSRQQPNACPATGSGGAPAAGRSNEFGFGEIDARNTLRGLGLAK